MSDTPIDQNPENVAFRQAGHALMGYLILRAGVVDQFFLLPPEEAGRYHLVPAFDTVDLQADLAALGKLEEPDCLAVVPHEG